MAANKNNSIQHGINAAQAHATNSQEQQHVQELASELQAGAQNTTAGNTAANALGANTAATNTAVNEAQSKS
ncbi:hypothetical protein PP175_04530 [Aneurinibacillus sp. Ricciae_BoGa-3]|uniref:hypothetical protein n=1 Tax=Aneurinibacillus sp. Ricciae_BoGa-3 TaxID=3022697 RepID=UPI00233F95D7|nr:hypothetical protein [Aneurinibacillus sp. Ricciae_BoGa-3]WCK55259.1 hypothetical protein PP175_04530 [Aneurinibacillus sp. Ricciae_BoGa-3]